MGFSSLDDWINEVTVNSKSWRLDWSKTTNAITFVAGCWYDLDQHTGYPAGAVYPGDYVINGSFSGAAWGWTTTTGWAYSSNTVLHNADGTGTLTQTTCVPVAGRTYRVEYTISGYSTGTCTVSIGGTSGTGRTANGQYIENITASDTTCLTFTPTNTARFTIDNVYVHELLGATPLSDTTPGSCYHGGNVSTDTKHIMNAGAWTSYSGFVPGNLVLIDKLLVYPFVDASVNTLQTLINNETLPRYTDGIGLRAYLVNYVTVGSTSVTMAVTYRNTASADKTLPLTVYNNTGLTAASAINQYQFGPFLPLASGDTGILNIKDIQFSASMGAAAGRCALVICKPLLYLPVTAQYAPSERDLLNQLPSLPQVKDGAYLTWLWGAGANPGTGALMNGYLDLCWG